MERSFSLTALSRDQKPLSLRPRIPSAWITLRGLRTSHLLSDATQRLIREADVAALRRAGLARMVVSAILLLTVVLAVSGLSITEPAAIKQIRAAEITLARVWEQVLNVPRVGLHDNFFELGGDSILAVQIVFRAREEGLALAARDLFQHQTLEKVAAVAQTAGTPAELAPVEPAPPADFPEARISQKDLDKLMTRIGGKRRTGTR